MKFYKYKQLQRMTFFGYDDLNATDTTSFSRTSVQSRTVATPAVAPVAAVVYAAGPPIVYAAAAVVAAPAVPAVTSDTKVLRFNINRLFQTQ